MNTLGVCSIAVDGIVQSTVPSSCFRIATYLLLSGSRMMMSRQRLKSIFWPDADLEKASANVRQNLVRIRRFQDENGFQLIGSNFTLVYLMQHGIDWDLHDFLDALDGDDEASIVSACELYGGDLLADIGASSPEFEEWLSDQRERLRSALIEKLVGALADSSLSPPARGLCAHKLLAIDPCNEQAFQILMTEAAEQGDHARLHHLFARCERQLMNEFGVGISDGTRGLYSQLSRNLHSHPPRNGSS
jgi:DNA-binding SARP family transcriptional activator